MTRSKSRWNFHTFSQNVRAETFTSIKYNSNVYMKVTCNTCVCVCAVVLFNNNTEIHFGCLIRRNFPKGLHKSLNSFYNETLSTGHRGTMCINFVFHRHRSSTFTQIRTACHELSAIITFHQFSQHLITPQHVCNPFFCCSLPNSVLHSCHRFKRINLSTRSLWGGAIFGKNEKMVV